MKKSISLLALCLILTSILSLPAIAQDTDKREFNTEKTEVNIAVANIFTKNNLIYAYYIDGDYISYLYSDYFRQPELVVGIKFHDNKGAFRMGTSLKYSNITTENDGGQIEKNTFKTFGSSLYLGYEWHSTISRVNIFYGFDVSTTYTSYSIKYEYISSYPSNSNTSESKAHEFTTGINPLLGVNFYITPQLSIGTEIKFTAEYVSGKSKSDSSNYLNSSDSKSSGFRTRFGPIGFLSINIHF